jgi:hypothetical protein
LDLFNRGHAGILCRPFLLPTIFIIPDDLSVIGCRNDRCDRFLTLRSIIDRSSGMIKIVGRGTSRHEISASASIKNIQISTESTENSASWWNQRRVRDSQGLGRRQRSGRNEWRGPAMMIEGHRLFQITARVNHCA